LDVESGTDAADTANGKELKQTLKAKKLIKSVMNILKRLNENSHIHIDDYVRQGHVVSEIMKLQPVPRSILDAGSGDDAYAISLGQRLKDSMIIGIEIIPEYVQIANSKL
jgi:methylase of polypeptide subunit release factors